MCAVKECEEQPFARGLCVKHYMRMRRHGDPEVVKPPGRPVDPFEPESELAELREQNTRLRKENAALKRKAKRRPR